MRSSRAAAARAVLRRACLNPKPTPRAVVLASVPAPRAAARAASRAGGSSAPPPVLPLMPAPRAVLEHTPPSPALAFCTGTRSPCTGPRACVAPQAAACAAAVQSACTGALPPLQGRSTPAACCPASSAGCQRCPFKLRRAAAEIRRQKSEHPARPDRGRTLGDEVGRSFFFDPILSAQKVSAGRTRGLAGGACTSERGARHCGMPGHRNAGIAEQAPGQNNAGIADQAHALVLTAAAEDALPAPAPVQAELVAAAHAAACAATHADLLKNKLDQVVQRGEKMWTHAQAMKDKTEAKAEQIQQQVSDLTRRQDSAMATAEALGTARGDVRAAQLSPGALGKRSSASTPSKPAKRNPLRDCRPAHSLREDMGPAAIAAAIGRKESVQESWDEVAPHSPVAEQMPGGLVWALHGPDTPGPIIKKGSVLTITTQAYKALVVEVLPHTKGRPLKQLDDAPVKVVCLFDARTVHTMGQHHDVPLALEVARNMRVNEVFQGDCWFGEPIKVQHIKEVGEVMYCDAWKQPDDDMQCCAALLAQGVYVCTGAFKMHKLPEDFACRTLSFCSEAAPPPGHALVVVPTLWADTDKAGNVLQHSMETAQYLAAPGVPAPIVLGEGLPDFPDLLSHASRVARWRMFVSACRAQAELRFATRLLNQHTLSQRTMSWLCNKARSLTEGDTETAASAVLADVSMSTVHEVLVRHGLVDGVQGRCVEHAACALARQRPCWRLPLLRACALCQHGV